MVSGTLGPAGISCVAAQAAVRGSVHCFLDGVPTRRAGAPSEPQALAAELAEAFPRLRERILDDLRGRFVIVVWNAATQEGLVAVDPLASRPIFHRESNAELRFADELRDLLAVLPSTPGPDTTAVARWLELGTLEQGETLYDGVERLPGGHFMQFRRGRWARRRYWRPRYETPLKVDRGEAVSLLRDGIGSAVERRAEGHLGIMLSGGIDSTSIAAIARLEPKVESLTAYSATFPYHPEADESETIRLSTTELELPWRPVSERAGTVLDATFEHTREWRVPPAAPTLFFQSPVIRAAAADGVRVLLDGQGGDELFGCSAYLIADALRGLRLRTARELAANLPGFGPSPDPQLMRSAIRRFGAGGATPWWLHRLRTAIGAARDPDEGLLRPSLSRNATTERDPWEWTRLDGPRWWAALADQLTRGRELILAHEYMRRKFASAGLLGAHPYLDDLELIDLVLRLPPELSFHQTVDRPLLREAVFGVVPERIRLRHDKSRFDVPFVESLSGPDAETLRQLLGERDTQLRRYANDAALRRVLDVRPGQQGPRWARLAWRLASTEQWLRLLDARDVPVTAY